MATAPTAPAGASAASLTLPLEMLLQLFSRTTEHSKSAEADHEKGKDKAVTKEEEGKPVDLGELQKAWTKLQDGHKGEVEKIMAKLLKENVELRKKSDKALLDVKVYEIGVKDAQAELDKVKKERDKLASTTNEHPFVACILDFEIDLFPPSIFLQPHAGLAAAKSLRSALRALLSPEVVKLNPTMMVYVYLARSRSLVRDLIAEGLIGDAEAFDIFVAEFNGAHPLYQIIEMRVPMEVHLQRQRAWAVVLARMSQCKLLVLGRWALDTTLVEMFCPPPGAKGKGGDKGDDGKKNGGNSGGGGGKPATKLPANVSFVPPFYRVPLSIVRMDPQTCSLEGVTRAEPFRRGLGSAPKPQIDSRRPLYAQRPPICLDYYLLPTRCRTENCRSCHAYSLSSSEMEYLIDELLFVPCRDMADTGECLSRGTGLCHFAHICPGGVECQDPECRFTDWMHDPMVDLESELEERRKLEQEEAEREAAQASKSKQSNAPKPVPKESEATKSAPKSSEPPSSPKPESTALPARQATTTDLDGGDTAQGVGSGQQQSSKKGKKNKAPAPTIDPGPSYVSAESLPPPHLIDSTRNIPATSTEAPLRPTTPLFSPPKPGLRSSPIDPIDRSAVEPVLVKVATLASPSTRDAARQTSLFSPPKRADASADDVVASSDSSQKPPASSSKAALHSSSKNSPKPPLKVEADVPPPKKTDTSSMPKASSVSGEKDKKVSRPTEESPTRSAPAPAPAQGKKKGKGGKQNDPQGSSVPGAEESTPGPAPAASQNGEEEKKKAQPPPPKVDESKGSVSPTPEPAQSKKKKKGKGGDQLAVGDSHPSVSKGATLSSTSPEEKGNPKDTLSSSKPPSTPKGTPKSMSPASGENYDMHTIDEGPVPPDLIQQYLADAHRLGATDEQLQAMYEMMAMGIDPSDRFVALEDEQGCFFAELDETGNPVAHGEGAEAVHAPAVKEKGKGDGKQ